MKQFSKGFSIVFIQIDVCFVISEAADDLVIY